MQKGMEHYWPGSEMDFPGYTNDETDIVKEARPDDILVPSLDPKLLILSNYEARFLRDTISRDKNELKSRILQVQKESYEIYPYPCIRAFHFVSLMMRNNPIYSRVLEAGKKGDTTFLDVGCCMGTDVRKLVHDGYPASSVLGSDLRGAFIQAGYKLFQDSTTCKIRFFSSDIFDIPTYSINSSSVEIPFIRTFWELSNRVTHLYAGALFHLFDEATQYAIALRLAILLKRDSGSVIFGRHQGLENAGLIADHMARIRYGHSLKSWRFLWRRVFIKLEGAQFTANRVVVDAEFKKMKWIGSTKTRMMYWSVRIL